MTAQWDGYTERSYFDEDALAVRDELADAARDGRWGSVKRTLVDSSELVNAVRPGGRSGFASLHQAAYRGDKLAALDLVGRGAWLMPAYYCG